MPQTLLIGILVVLAISGILMAIMQYAALGPKAEDRIRKPRPMYGDI